MNKISDYLTNKEKKSFKSEFHDLSAKEYKNKFFKLVKRPSAKKNLALENLPIASAPLDGKIISLSNSNNPKIFLCIVRHYVVPNKGRLCIVPSDEIDSWSLGEYDYFLIATSNPDDLDLVYAIFKSRMVAVNCRLFSQKFLNLRFFNEKKKRDPRHGDRNHIQGGAIDWFPLPALTPEQKLKLCDCGKKLRSEEQKLISKGKADLENICNPPAGTTRYKILREVDKIIDSCYGLNTSNPITDRERREVLLDIYAAIDPFEM